jgi:hypothetical protein
VAAGPHVAQQIPVAAVFNRRAAVPLAGHDLEDDDPEAEHVGFGRDVPVVRVLRGHVPAACIKRSTCVRVVLSCWPATNTIRYSQGSNRPSGHLFGLVSPERSGQSEIRDLGSHVGSQQDVAGLEVPVDDPQPGLLVEVQQAARDPADDRVSLAPIQSLLLPSPCITQRNG